MVDNYLNNILEDVKKQNNGEKVDDEKVLKHIGLPLKEI